MAISNKTLKGIKEFLDDVVTLTPKDFVLKYEGTATRKSIAEQARIKKAYLKGETKNG